MNAPARSANSCPRCGAPRTDRNAGRFCEYCGAAVSDVETPGAGEITAASEVARQVAPQFEPPARRFERLEGHPDYPALLAKRPSSAGPVAQNLVGLIVAVVVLVMGVVALNAFRSQNNWFTSSRASWATFVPYVIIGLGVLLVARVLGRTTRFASSPLEARPARVVDERNQVRGGGDGPSSTLYFVTIEGKDGRRAELRASGSLAGRVAAGDMGVAYVRDDQLLDFERLAV